MPTYTVNLTGQALTKTDDTNVTLTLGGTPATALLKATSLTLGWTGTLAATRGGTGLNALGTAGQLLKVNAGGTALEYFTPTYGSGTVTSVSGTTDRITSSGGTTPVIDIASTYVGQTSLTTLGTITTGTWDAGQVKATKNFIDTALGIGINSAATFTNSLDNNGVYVGGAFIAIKTDDNNESGGLLAGIIATAEIAGLGNIASVFGISSTVLISGDASQGNALGIAGGVQNEGAGVLTQAIGVKSDIENLGGGSIDDGFNFKVGSNNATNKYGFFNDVAGTLNVFTSTEISTGFKYTDGSEGNGKVLTSDASGNASWTTPTTGTVTSVSGTASRISSTGGATPVIDIDAAYVGQTSITTLGTIGAGTWNATAIGTTKGGTNITTYTTGDILYASASNVLSKLAAGSNGQVLTLAAGIPSWATAGGGITQGTTTIASGATGNLGINLAGLYSSATAATNRGANIDQAAPFNVGLGYQTFSGAITGNNSSVGVGYQSMMAHTSGNSNVGVGYQALKGVTTSSRNVAVGYLAGFSMTTTTGSSVFIGAAAGYLNTASYNIGIGDAVMSGAGAGNQNVGIGHEALSTLTSGQGNVAIGYNAGRLITTTTGNTFCGYLAGNIHTGNYATYLGFDAGYNVNFASSMAIGYYAIPTAANQCVIGSSGDGTNGSITNGVYFNSVTAAAPRSITLNACGFSGSNGAGGSFTIAGGAATGTGAAGDIVLRTSVKTSSGTTLQTLGDSYRITGKYVDLTEITATAFVRINIPTSTVAGGIVTYTIEANDGTDFQSLTGTCRWDAVNKAGTTTIVITDLQNGAGASSSVSTLTNTITAVDSGSGNVDFKANAVSSLTQTVLRINCQVLKNFGTGSISAS